MNLLLNASNLRFGGGLTVGHELLRAVLPLRSRDAVHILHPAYCGYESLSQDPNIFLHEVSDSTRQTPWDRLQFHYRTTQRLIKAHSIDKIISLGNVAIPAQGRPQLLYIQLPQLVYPESPAWQRMSWKEYMRNRAMVAWVTANLKHATTYALQTLVMQERFTKQFPIKDKKTVLLPNAAVLPWHSHSITPLPAQYNAARPLRLLFLSKLYPHKNFDVLLPLAKLIQEQSIPVTISLTLDATDSAATAAFLQQLKQANISTIIRNIGHLPITRIAPTLNEHDALFLPTLLESFSGAYAEVLHAARPIFTSNMDFAHGICGEAGIYFDPLKPESILKELTTAIANPTILQEKATQAFTLAALLPDWPTIAQQFSTIIDTFA